MSEQEICKKLQDKGFDEKTSIILAENLIQVNPDLRPLLKVWLNGGIETDYKAHGISLKELMSEHEMQYQAALLTMDWILQDPVTAFEAIKKGIR